MSIDNTMLFDRIITSQYSLSESTAAGKSIRERTEIPPDYQWDLADIYHTENEWQTEFTKLTSSLDAISRYQGRLSSSATILLECLKHRDELGIIGGKLFAYARMHRDEDATKSKYQAMTSKTESLLAEAAGATAFIEPEILAMPNDKLASLRDEEPRLKEYSFYFDNLLRQKKHVLSPEQEELLAKLSEVAQASETTFHMLAHADMSFPETLAENGDMTQLSEGRYGSLIRSSNRSVREQAFQNLFNTYKQYRNTFASTLNGNVRKNIFFSKTRKYDSVLQSALDSDNVPLEVYDNLIATIHHNLSPLHRYVALKKKALQLDSIHMYDLYTPLIANVAFNIPYHEGVDIVKSGLSPLGTEYQRILEKALSENWIDVYENKGKQTGAYSWGVYKVHPFILLNYNDRYDDVSTLAHELGHAIHSYYSHAAQPYSMSSYTIFCAEVASTTNEILLLKHMLEKTEDKKQKIYLLNQHLEMVRATVYRQTMFAEFERDLYELAENGEAITADGLEEMWQQLNKKYYGPDIVVDDQITIEWARIPHFYSSFYVYQYVTGYSAATALANQILTEGEPAQTRYISFLKSGGSDYSLDLLRRAGVDMASPKPIETTLSLFSNMLTELEQLISE